MSPRTYDLITNPKYIDFISESVRSGCSLEDVKFPVPSVSLPALNKAEDISYYLGISPELIWTLIRSPRYKYNTFSVRKKSGGSRVISAPRTYMKVVQWWINDVILSKFPQRDNVFGFVPGVSYVDNAAYHHGAVTMMNVDIKNFFPSIKSEDVLVCFMKIGYSKQVALGLSALTTYAGFLPQGAPTSPNLSNIVFSEFDEKISNICKLYNLKYSRYADDMTFSSIGRVPKDFHRIISRELFPKFLLNDEKTQYMGAGDKKEVTGLVLGRDGPAISREKLNGLRGWLHQIIANPEQYVDDLDRLSGTLAMVRMVGGRGTGPILLQGGRAMQAIEQSLRI
ncbi:hypothetical protein DDF62_04300 [Caulobacter radicis]|uniref:retron St85 family RNA-directed DNA polymerase n=1 Tax=Caulobacter radicis TaxID=2172650 RepID=UPI000D57204D|nr:retron St85 family RNA-directed DNA polymerase [Caulobacter radicis]PVM92376.1 hypothetical protein DDF62_04300 [Caulobacter radicis]